MREKYAANELGRGRLTQNKSSWFHIYIGLYIYHIEISPKIKFLSREGICELTVCGLVVVDTA
jgi:hypothetical protein